MKTIDLNTIDDDFIRSSSFEKVVVIKIDGSEYKENILNKKLNYE